MALRVETVLYIVFHNLSNFLLAQICSPQDLFTIILRKAGKCNVCMLMRREDKTNWWFTTTFTPFYCWYILLIRRKTQTQHSFQAIDFFRHQSLCNRLKCFLKEHIWYVTGYFSNFYAIVAGTQRKQVWWVSISLQIKSIENINLDFDFSIYWLLIQSLCNRTLRSRTGPYKVQLRTLFVF